MQVHYQALEFNSNKSNRCCKTLAWHNTNKILYKLNSKNHDKEKTHFKNIGTR